MARFARRKKFAVSPPMTSGQIDYKDLLTLKSYITETTGKIVLSRITGTGAYHQRQGAPLSGARASEPQAARYTDQH